MTLGLCTLLHPVLGEVGRKQEHLHSLAGSSGLNFGSKFRETHTYRTPSPTFHKGPGGSETSPRSLRSPGVSYGNTREKNCPLPRKDVPLGMGDGGRKLTVEQGILGRVERRKKDKHRSAGRSGTQLQEGQRTSPRTAPRPRAAAPAPAAPQPAGRFCWDRRLDSLLAW